MKSIQLISLLTASVMSLGQASLARASQPSALPAVQAQAASHSQSIPSVMPVQSAQPKSIGTADNPTPPEDMARPTFCAGEDKVWDMEIDRDIVIKDDANLTVMFHGNRFPASSDLIEAFEKAHPGIKVSYSSLPPISVIRKLNGHDLSKLKGADDIAQKIAPLDYPDVVMVPEVNLNKNMYADNLLNPEMYSRISGMVAVVRADDRRVNELEDLKKAEVRFVLAGMQSQTAHAVYLVPEAFFGKDLFAGIKKRSSTGFSKTTHHRSVPAHILLGCEDAGFQFAQSQAYLEKRFPGKLKFLKLPNSMSGIFDPENSYIAVTKKSTRKESARKFRDFVLGPEGQAILARYSLSLR